MWTSECEETVNKLYEQLSALYSNYVSEYRANISRKPAQLFKGWMGISNPSEDVISAIFLRDTEAVVTQLSSALSLLEAENVGAANGYAAKAVDFMLTSKPSREKTTTEWYTFIAEYYSEPLLQFLCYEDLKRIRDDYVGRTPKRMMFPRQLELFEKMNSLLEKKHPNSAD